MFTKITDEDRSGKGVTGLADTPELETLDMQSRFDELGNMAVDGLNKLIEELSDDGKEDGHTSGAANIGAEVPDGVTALPTLQAVINALASKTNENSNLKHSHDNKATLDAITAEIKAGYDRLVTLLADSIRMDVDAVSNSAAAIPTSKAVTQTLAEYGYDTLKRTIFPIGAVVLNTTGVNPSSYISGTWTEIYDLFDASKGVYAWRRTS